ncbi:MAG: carbamoyl-phosphate synthase large subunit, partial [Clostridiales bacterium]|nr:carbamoyl-phosphate synthase large subunit [Clostridiales bacterium]
MLNKDIKKVLVIGSGPIVIGQGSEHDYCATQACLALKENSIKTVLVNSNPTSMVTDGNIADKVYIEPLNIDTIKRIIEKEKPDSVLATVGGITGLEIGLGLSLNGYLEENKINLLGINPQTIETLQNRQAFKNALIEIGEPTVASKVVSSVEAAEKFANEIGYPVIIRPAYTLGGDKEDFCYSEWELKEVAESTLKVSKLHEILVEKSISGWKELEFEVVRDNSGNCISVCSLENVDPVGIHTGDSIIVAPAQTLNDVESERLRASALNIISKFNISGSCNVKFAIKPDGSEYAVLGVDATLGRSSAIVSKVTGYPVAQVCTKIALGFALDEIQNDIVGGLTACNEPNIDYCALKFPKWSFDNFVEFDRQLDTSMKSTGETLSIGSSFELAFMKAIRSIDIGIDTPSMPKFENLSLEELYDIISKSDDERIFAVYTAIKKGASFEKLYELTKIDYWFMSKLKNIANMEIALKDTTDEEIIKQAKAMGFPYSAIWTLANPANKIQHYSAFKMVDTCAAEFDAKRPYFYSSFDEENEAQQYIEQHNDAREKVLIVGSG